MITLMNNSKGSYLDFQIKLNPLGSYAFAIQTIGNKQIEITKNRIKTEMQINRPFKGVFKGVGSTQKTLDITRRNFPLIRNKHQFQYTHSHPNTYESSSNYFHMDKLLAQSSTNRFVCEKVNKNAKQSGIVLGNDKNDFKSLNEVNYRKYEYVKPVKPIHKKQEWVQVANEPSKCLFRTNNQQAFQSGRSLSSKQNVAYKDWRNGQRFNPITGETKNIKSTFGFQDFKYNGDKQRAYRANNFTRIPQVGQKYDIISGRKLGFA